MAQGQDEKWLLRLRGEVRGPFPTVQIARYLLLQRLGPEDEISRDATHWYPIKEVAEVDPQKRLATPSLEEGERQQLLATQRWIAEHPELFTYPSQTRGVEYELALEDALLRNRLHLPSVNRKLGISVALILSITVVTSAFLIPKGGEGGAAQCDQPPASGVNWDNCRLQGSQFGNSDLRHARLRNADLSGSVLRAANLSQSDIAYTNLSLANLRGANLQGADMTGANLRNADLRSASLKGVNLSYADLSGADLSGADVEGARFDYAILNDEYTCMPKSLGRCIPARRNP
jgi:hypothetical protein